MILTWAVLYRPFHLRDSCRLAESQANQNFPLSSDDRAARAEIEIMTCLVIALSLRGL